MGERVTNKPLINCYLCGRKLKEAEVIPGQDKQVCDICEAEYECY